MPIMPPRDNDSSSSPTLVKQQQHEQTNIESQAEIMDRANQVQVDRDKSGKKKKKKKSDKEHKRKSKSSRDKPKPSSDEPPPEVGGNTRLLPPDGNDVLTVSQFLSRQRSVQREAESYRTDSARSGAPGGKLPLLADGDGELDYRKSPVSSRGSRTVDAVPSDHPSSSIVQTHRTCTLCHRTLARSQFSERDRYLVHLSLGPGAVCRTCTMTVCATKLKCMRSHQQLLVDYANRGEYLMNAGRLPALGYSPAGAAAEGALVVRDGDPPDAAGNELVAFEPRNSSDGSQRPNPFAIPATGADVNAPFSGIVPEEERPTHVADCKYIDSVLAMPSYAKLNSMELFSCSKDVSVSMAALDAVKLYGTVESEYFAPHDGDGNKVVPRSARKKTASGVESPNNASNVNPKSIVCLVIGEGRLPRTAVLASVHYGWTTLSIDPALSEDWDGYQDDVPNYTGYSGTISEFMSDEYTDSYLELGSSQSDVQHLVIVGIQMTKDQMRLKGRSNINEIRARYDDVPTTLVSMSPLRKATLAPKRRDGQCGSKLEKDVGYEPNCSYIDEGVFSTCRLVEVWNFHNEDDGGEEEEDDFDSGGQGSYPEETIEGNRRDGHQRFSMEQLSAEGMSKTSDSVYRRFQEHVSRYEDGNEKHEVEKKQFNRKNTVDSMSTLSTKGMMPMNDPHKKRSSSRHKSNGEESSRAIVLAINSRLEAENSRRKSKEKSKRKHKRSVSGPRPIPDDIPEGFEIDPENFVGEGIPQSRPEEPAEWNNVPTYGDKPQEIAAGVCSEHIDAYTDKGSSYKSFDNPVGDYYPGDAERGTLPKYDDDESYSNQSGEYYGHSEENEDNLHRDNEYVQNKAHVGHVDEQSFHSGYSDEHNHHHGREKGDYRDCDEPAEQYHSSDAWESGQQKQDDGEPYNEQSDYYKEEERHGADLNCHSGNTNNAHLTDDDQGSYRSNYSNELGDQASFHSNYSREHHDDQGSYHSSYSDERGRGSYDSNYGEGDQRSYHSQYSNDRGEGDQRSYHSQYSNDRGEEGSYHSNYSNEQGDQRSYHSQYSNEHGDQRSYHSQYSNEHSDQRSNHSNYSNDEQGEQGSYDSNYSNDNRAEQGSNYRGNHGDQPSRYSNQQDQYHSHYNDRDVPVRTKTEDYSAYDRGDDDHSGNYEYDDYEDQTSTGIDVLNEFNASRNRLRASSDGEEDEEDDQFHVPEYFGRGEEEDQFDGRTQSSGSLGAKLKPWHDTKDKFGNSFMSFDSNCYD